MIFRGGVRRTGRDRGRLASILVAVSALALGLLVTLTVAAFDRAETKQQRQLTFEREAEAIQQKLIARVDELTASFETSLSFLGATHPGSPDVYADYIRRQDKVRGDFDPGVMFIEEVPRDQLAALEEREHRLGNRDFRVTTFDRFSQAGPALVVTRSADKPGSTPFPYIGYDVSIGRKLLFPDEFPEHAPVLQVASSSLLFTSSIGSADADDLLRGRDDIPEVSLFFAGEVFDSRGDQIGWALEFIEGPQLSQGIAIPDGFHYQLSMASIDRPIASWPESPEVGPTETDLYDQRQVVALSQQATLEVWADPAQGGATGVFSQTRLWLVGLGPSLTLALAASGWMHYRRRLAGASFELQHARTLATTDVLTGLLNRQGLIDAARQRPDNEPASLFFIDLDGFKAVNDQDGHEAGDTVLTATARALTSSFRRQDLVSRLGGDEFVVFADGYRSESDARHIAERVVAKISEIDSRLSCSLGITQRRVGDNHDVKELLRQADEAMYSAKRSGGDSYEIRNP